MAIQTQFRRGNTYAHSLFTGASGEITVDLDKKVAVVHDGATVGGFPLSLNAYTAAAYNQANTAITIAGLAFNAANVDLNYSVAGVTGNVSNIQLAAGITSSGLLTTANISELTNLYFTNARVYAAVTGNLALKSNLADLTTANVVEVNNLYFTNARSRSTISIASSNTSGNGSYDSATGVISINAANVTVSSSAPVSPYVGDLWIHADTAVQYLFFGDGDTFQWAEIGTTASSGSGSTISVAGVQGDVSNVQLASGISQTGILTTANVTEVTNLYFTNARAVAALTAGQSITIDANGRINSTATGGSSSTYGDSNVVLLGYATNANVALKANVADLKTANVSELTNLYFTNARVYSNVTQLGYITSSTLSGYATNAQLSSYTTNTTGSWTVTTGTNTYSITVPSSGTYQLWVRGNIPNGIIAYSATAVVTNTNVPVVGVQYAWVYNGGGSPIDFTSIPNQFVGTSNTIVRSSTAPSATTNRFDFGINNSSGSSQTVYWGYVTL